MSFIERKTGKRPSDSFSKIWNPPSSLPETSKHFLRGFSACASNCSCLVIFLYMSIYCMGKTKSPFDQNESVFTNVWTCGKTFWFCGFILKYLANREIWQSQTTDNKAWSVSGWPIPAGFLLFPLVADQKVLINWTRLIQIITREGGENKLTKKISSSLPKLYPAWDRLWQPLDPKRETAGWGNGWGWIAYPKKRCKSIFIKLCSH